MRTSRCGESSSSRSSTTRSPPRSSSRPDLITISAGGNNIIRPGSDPDAVAAKLDDAVARLKADGATVVVFTGPDIAGTPILKSTRGKVAIFNENVHTVALRNGAIVADMWALRELGDPRMWAPDRLHFSPVGHNTIAKMVLETLGVENDLEPFVPEPLPVVPWHPGARGGSRLGARALRAVDRSRLRGRSSGDHIQPKRPTFTS